MNNPKTIYDISNSVFVGDNLNSKRVNAESHDIIAYNNSLNALSEQQRYDFSYYLSVMDNKRQSMFPGKSPINIKEATVLIEYYKIGAPIFDERPDGLSFANCTKLEDMYDVLNAINKRYVDSRSGLCMLLNQDEELVKQAKDEKFSLSLGEFSVSKYNNLENAYRHLKSKYMDQETYLPTNDGLEIKQTLSKMHPDYQKEAVVLIFLADKIRLDAGLPVIDAKQAKTLIENFGNSGSVITLNQSELTNSELHYLNRNVAKIFIHDEYNLQNSKLAVGPDNSIGIYTVDKKTIKQSNKMADIVRKAASFLNNTDVEREVLKAVVTSKNVQHIGDDPR